MTMNNYFHKHMLTHTLGRYHFKTTEEERIRLIKRRKPWQTELPKVLNTMDGQFLSAKTMKLSLPEVLPTVEEKKKLLLIQIFLNLALVRKMVKFIITVLME